MACSFSPMIALRPTADSAAFSGRQPGTGDDALLIKARSHCASAPEHLEQELARGRGGVQVLRQRAERHPLSFGRGHNGEQGADSDRPSRSSFYTTSTSRGRTNLERPRQADAGVFRAGGVILEQMTRINPSGDQRVALQVRALPVGTDDTRM